MPGHGDAPGQCRLLVGPAAISAQALLACFAVLALLLKRHQEDPQRPYRIWLLDVSKQVVSTAAAHFAGIFIAIWLASHAVSQCAWYFVAFSVDTTLGVCITVSLHKLAVRKAQQHCSAVGKGSASSCLASIAECGDYGSPPKLARWWPQLVEFSTCVLVARAFCALAVWSTKIFLVSLATWLDFMFRGHPDLLLYFTMVVCPLSMNVLQALIQDSVLRVRKAHGNGHSEGHLPLTNDKELHLTPLSSGRGHESAGLIASRASQGDV